MKLVLFPQIGDLFFFYDLMTVHRNRFLVNKTNRCTEFQFSWNLVSFLDEINKYLRSHIRILYCLNFKKKGLYFIIHSRKYIPVNLLTFWRRNFLFNFSTPCI